MVEIVKAGWLFKESSFLKRWKKYWFSLSQDGYLRYFHSPDNLVAEKSLFLPNNVIAIQTGASVDSNPPGGHRNTELIKLVTRNDSWILCGESMDDMMAWQIALEQARVINQPQRQMGNQQMPSYLVDVLQNNPNNGYPMYHRGVNYSGRYPSRIVHTPQGPITVVYVNDYRYPYRYYDNSGLALGALTGAAVASTLMYPFWFPLFWC